jgi:type II restriction enzyme
MSEGWVASNVYCIACGSPRLTPLPANSRARDFQCPRCGEVFELKATKSRIARRMTDGAYSAMSQRILSDQAPNLMLLGYRSATFSVADLLVIPRHFLTLDAIQERPPLGPSARRAGWIGCNILIDRLPPSGRVPLVQDGRPLPSDLCRQAWQRTLFLRERPAARSWLVAVMECIERLPLEFTLAQVYDFESELAAIFPANSNIRPKLRQQLQFLRDSGYLRFLGEARYRRN